MASRLHMNFSLTAREEIDAGSSQTHSVIDSVAQRRWGGERSASYTSHTTDGSSKIIVYENAILKYATLNAGGAATTDLTGATWLDTSHADYTTRGALPTNITGFAIEHVGRVGNAAITYISWGENSLTTLSHNYSDMRGFVMPCLGTLDKIDIFTTATSLPDHYVIVNVLVAGT